MFDGLVTFRVGNWMNQIEFDNFGLFSNFFGINYKHLIIIVLNFAYNYENQNSEL